MVRIVKDPQEAAQRRHDGSITSPDARKNFSRLKPSIAFGSRGAACTVRILLLYDQGNARESRKQRVPQRAARQRERERIILGHKVGNQAQAQA